MSNEVGRWVDLAFCVIMSLAAGGHYPDDQLSTVHQGRCPICLREGQWLTELRDYGCPVITEEFVAARRAQTQEGSQ